MDKAYGYGTQQDRRRSRKENRVDDDEDMVDRLEDGFFLLSEDDTVDPLPPLVAGRRDDLEEGG